MRQRRSKIAAELELAALRRAHVVDLNAQGADLARADFRGLFADSVNLRSANLSEANFSGATLRMCMLDNARAESACFDGGRLEDSTATAADFSLSTFRGAHLTETSFARAVLRESILDDAEGDGIDLRGAELTSASLKGVRFDEADFRGADLRGADLSRGRFHSADFRGALLEGARFDDADCGGSSFDSGEGPLASRQDENRQDTPDAAEIAVLTELLSSLPEAISGASSGDVMNRIQNLIDKLAVSVGYPPEQRKALGDQLANLTNPDGFDPELLRQMIAAVNSGSNEPTEDLKPWLEPIMKTILKNRKV